LACLAGNLGLQQLASLPPPLWLLVLALAAGAGLARAQATRAGLPAIVVLAFCWTGLAAERGLQSRWPSAADGRDLELTGYIDAQPTADAARTVFSLRVTSSVDERAPRRVRLSWYAPVPKLAAGQELTLVARLRAPRGLQNPGGFDFERWLFLEGFDATGYVRAGRLHEDSEFILARQWLRWRTRLAARIDGLVADADAAALLVALSLGDRSRFEERHWTVLQRTGTSHLVAVSGLHIGLIAALTYFAVLRLALALPYLVARHAHALAALLCIVPASLYAALAGFALPTRRALLMVLVAQGLVLMRGRWPVSGGLSLALIVVLLLEPLASLTASFWLSFGAVALILATHSPRQASHDSRRSRFAVQAWELCRLQWALTLGLVPVVIWFFGLLAPSSLLVNLLAIPVFSCVVLPLSLIASALAGLAGNGELLIGIAAFVAGSSWRALEWAASLPIAAFAIAKPPLPVLWLALAAVAMSLMPRAWPGRGLALVGLVPLIAGSRAGPAPGEARVTVFDVGHGLAVAVETATQRLLYDAGPVYRSGFDTGAEIVGPALAAISSRPLDLMVLSHADSDHSGGAASMLDRYRSVAVLAGPDVKLGNATVCATGQAWTSDGVAFTVLHPPAGFSPEGNESSCVLRIETAGGTVLLTGDIERRAEARLSRAAAIAADVVIVPHHGSLTSSSDAFVRAVAADVAIVSAGFNNRWGFPRAEVRERWESAGARMLVTGDEGAIDLELTGAGIEITTARAQGRRYWHAKRDGVSGASGAGAL
jgi:competence protein ComEC